GHPTNSITPRWAGLTITEPSYTANSKRGVGHERAVSFSYRSGSKGWSVLCCPGWSSLALLLAPYPSYVLGGSAFAGARVHACGRFVSWTCPFPRTLIKTCQTLRFSDYPAFLLELRLVDLPPRKTLL